MEALWFESCKKRNFPGYTILVPSVSIGNVGQLTVDVLISTLKPDQIAILHHAALLPIVGCNAYQDIPGGITTSADLHVCHQHKLLILQIRAPHARGRKREFVTALSEFASSLVQCDSGTDGCMVVLGGCQAANRADNLMTGGKLRYYANTVFTQSPKLDKIRNIGPRQLELVSNESGENVPFLPMSGYVQELIKESSLHALALLIFIDEGDNTADAAELAAYFYSWLMTQTDKLMSLRDVKWIVPPSWKNMFGAPAPPALFS